ncbi:MAG: hypothetical protein ACTILG_00425 [Sphingobacterium sp.]
MKTKIYLIVLFALFSACKKDENTAYPESKNKLVSATGTSTRYNYNAIVELRNALSEETDVNYKYLLQKRINDIGSLLDSPKAVNSHQNINIIGTNKKSIKKLSDITYLSPQDKKELEDYYIDLYGERQAADLFNSTIGGSFPHLSLSGVPNSSFRSNFKIVENVLGLWRVEGIFTVRKSDQIIITVTDQTTNIYAEIESIDAISSRLTGINSLLGQTISWEHTSGSSENHGRYADLYIDGVLSNSNPALGFSNPYYTSTSVYVNYMTEAEKEQHGYQ